MRFCCNAGSRCNAGAEGPPPRWRCCGGGGGGARVGQGVGALRKQARPLHGCSGCVPRSLPHDGYLSGCPLDLRQARSALNAVCGCSHPSCRAPPPGTALPPRGGATCRTGAAARCRCAASAAVTPFADLDEQARLCVRVHTCGMCVRAHACACASVCMHVRETVCICVHARACVLAYACACARAHERVGTSERRYNRFLPFVGGQGTAGPWLLTCSWRAGRYTQVQVVCIAHQAGYLNRRWRPLRPAPLLQAQRRAPAAC